MISKELLSEALDARIDNFTAHDGVIYINRASVLDAYAIPKYGNFEKKVNIYELAHKCKEWATKHKYMVSSLFRMDRNEIRWAESNAWKASMGEIAAKRFKANTEPEAVFKACEYILKEIDNGKS